MIRGSRKPRVVVVGAGAFGGWTARHLLRGGADVTLVDAWGAGHSRSSSGGESRVIRAVYGGDRMYTQMVHRSYELWEELEKESSVRLYEETGALWLLPGEDEPYLRAAEPHLEDFGFPLERPSVESAARRYPQIDFTDVASVAFEVRAGILSARRACEVNRRRFEADGGVYRVGRVAPPDLGRGKPRSVRIATQNAEETLEADAFVFACGPWLGRLFPEAIGEHLRPSRQEVYYFGTPAGTDAYRPENLPVWIDFAERIFYGIPDAHRRGFKIADDTRGETMDPTTADRRPMPGELERVRAFLARRFPALAEAPLVESRVCQYANSPDGDLIADRHPGAGNVWLVGGGSGHGFKLSPAFGERVARRVLGEEEAEPKFRLDRLGKGEERTQFDAGGTR